MKAAIEDLTRLLLAWLIAVVVYALVRIGRVLHNKRHAATVTPEVRPVGPPGFFHLSDGEIRVLRFACEYCRDQMEDGDYPEFAGAWDDLRRRYRNALIGLWAAGRNGGWVEERHAMDLFYGAQTFLTRNDLSRLPYFTVDDAVTLDRVMERLRDDAVSIA